MVFQGDRLESSYEEVPGQWGIEIDFQFETEYGIEEVTAQRGGIWLYGGVVHDGLCGVEERHHWSASRYHRNRPVAGLDIRNTVIHNMSAYGCTHRVERSMGTTICSTIAANPRPLCSAARTS